MSTVTVCGPPCGNPHCDRRMFPGKLYCCNACALKSMLFGQGTTRHAADCPTPAAPNAHTALMAQRRTCAERVLSQVVREDWLGCPSHTCSHGRFVHDWCEDGPVCCVAGCGCGLPSVTEESGKTDVSGCPVVARPGETYANANMDPTPNTESEK